MLKKLFILITILVLVGGAWPPLNAFAQTLSQPDRLLITEIQTGGLSQNELGDFAEDAKAEFVELYNPNDEAVSVEGWQLQYLTSSHDGRDTPTRVLGNLSGDVAPNEFLLFAYEGYIPELVPLTFTEKVSTGSLAKTGGSVRLVDNAGTPIDIVGWGSANSNIVESAAAVAPPPGKSLERCSDENGFPVDTDNNKMDLTIYENITPRAISACPIPEEPEDPLPPIGAENPTSCEGLVISELLPNPAGADAGKEFIELHNPTQEIVALDGCALQTSSSSQLFMLSGISLEPGSYKAYYASLNLPNSAGGTVWLLSSENVELQVLTYPGGMEDDSAWAVVNGFWQKTFAPTPDTINVAMPVKPCPSAQIRDEGTGRCKKITGTLVTSQAACKTGQERNPETNRCRSVLGASTVLKSCKADESRNPETNRCRKNIAATLKLAACKEGYERNASTNRCRKVTPKQESLANVTDIRSTDIAGNQNFWITGAIIFAAIAYGVFEWRDDILLRLRRFRSKI